MNINNSLEDSLFNDEGPIFMGAKREKSEASRIGLYGVPYDGTTSFRPGTRFGPDSIREVSQGLETYCPELNMDLTDINFVDFGSARIPLITPESVIKKVKLCTHKLNSLGLKPLMIGGEHSITVGAISAVAEIYSDLIVIQLDAHADLRDEWLGSKFSHACTMKRCLEVLPSQTLFQIGIRSGTKDEFAEMYANKRLIPHVKGHQAVELQSALSPYVGKPIYLTIDIDWFDPSCVPGTGTPEPGGYYWQDLSEIIQIIKNHNIVAADLVELSPHLDHSMVSSIFAAKITRSLILLMNQKK